MFSRASVLALLALSVLLIGCVGPYKPITQNPLDGYDSVTVLSNVPQEEIRMQIIPSNAGGQAGAQFGLIGALVGSAIDAGVNNSRAKEAEAAVEALRVALRDSHIPTLVHTTLEADLKDFSWSQAAEYRPSNLVGNELTKLVDEGQFETDVVLLVNTDVSMTPSYETVELTANYWVYPIASVEEETNKKTSSNQRSKKPKAIYSNQAIYQAPAFPPATATRKLTEEELAAEIQVIEEKYAALLAETPRGKTRTLRTQKTSDLKALKRKQVPVDPENTNGGRWIANDGALLKQAIDEGARELGKLIAMDLRGEHVALETYPMSQAGFARLYLISTDPETGRQLYRVAEGGLQGKILSKATSSNYVVKALRQ